MATIPHSDFADGLNVFLETTVYVVRYNTVSLHVKTTLSKIFEIYCGYNTCTYLNIVKNIPKNLFFCDSKVRVIVIRVRTRMNNPIHVQVHVIKFWDLQLQQSKLLLMVDN